MLLRRDEHGVLAIGQASHAWISGQLARAWGDPAFGSVEPREEVCLGAEQHDIGMALWDHAPSFNPDTGLPHGFTEMPLDLRATLWREAPRRLVRQSRHAALLCAMHGERLYARREGADLPPSEAGVLAELLADLRAEMAVLRGALAADPATARELTDERLARNSDLVWTWDLMSLALCLDWSPWRAEGVPLAAGGSTSLELAPGEAPMHLSVNPWPFRERRVHVRCEGQRLAAGGYPNEKALRSGLADAPWETLAFTLVPARSA